MKKLLILLLLLFVSNIFAFDENFEPKENLTVGDRAVLSVKANGLTLDSLDKEKVSGLNFGDFELLDIKQGVNGAIDFVLTSFKAGKVELLSVDIPYIVNGDNKFVKTTAIPIEIKSVMDPQKPSTDIADIKGIFVYGHGISWYLKLLLVLLLLIAAGYFIYLYIKKRNRKPTQEEIIMAIPPKEYAISQLEKLKEENLIEKGQIKEYYDKLSDILRFYVSRVYKIDGMEKTTTELYHLLKNYAPADFNRDLKQYLITCDFVKFAKVVPSQQDMQDDFVKAKGFVERI